MKRFRFRKSTKYKGDRYEEHCASKFRHRGCQVTVNGKSGDFGADLIIRKFLFKKEAIVQCKYLSGKNAKVGTKAIQEAVAAKCYYNAKQAIVCTNRTFTKNAVLLADACKVKLYEDF